MRTLKTLIYSLVLSLFFSQHLHADCSYELFNISSVKGTKVIDFLEQLSDECELTIIVSDAQTKKMLTSKLNKTHLKNLTLDEVLSVILNENNISYTLENNILKISYLITKILSIDYILSQRASTTNTDITLSSSATSGDSTSTGTEGSTSSGSTTESGIKISSNDEVKFWEKLDEELRSVINRGHDDYKADAPIINKNAGLITVTSTMQQMKRLEDYLNRLQKKVQLQVLIDVQILSVSMSEGKSTGIDWAQIYKLQNLTVGTNLLKTSDVGTFTGSTISTVDSTINNTSSSLFNFTGSLALDEVIKFLKTQGDVTSISNPKVLTLNNQPALITVGTEFFYKLTSSESITTTATSTSQSEDVQSVFAGVLLDITPEIASDRTITLKINPSLSETTSDLTNTDNTNRTMPPDLNRRQLSSVVTVKDGNKVILGGLISTKTSQDGSQVPLLGSIPILGNLFKYEERTKTVQELVIIIEPHIIKKEKNTLSLKDLGYKGLQGLLLHNEDVVSKKLNNVDVR